MVILLAISVGTYFLPTFIVAWRNHQNSVAIAVLNLLLGWTLLGWVAALVWSLTGIPADSKAKN